MHPTSIPPPITAYWVFYLVSLFTIASALAVLTMRNMIHAALALGSCFFGVATLYVLLHAQFLAVAQVLIYVGDITVLILFALMLTRGVAHPTLHRWGVPFFVGAAAATVIAALICVYLANGQSFFIPSPHTRPLESLGAYGIVREFSREMLTTYLLPFEVASGILLMALVGSIIVAREEGTHDAP